MPVRLRLTVERIRQAKADVKEIWMSDDDGSRGNGRLVIRISLSGTKLFYFRYSSGGTKKLISIGPWSIVSQAGSFTLEQARTKAREFSLIYRNTANDVRSYVSNGEMQKVVPSPNESQDSIAWGGKLVILSLCNLYVESLKRRGKYDTARNTRSLIRCHVEGTKWAEISAAAATTDDITDLVRSVVDKGFETTARHLRRMLHAAYKLQMMRHRDPRQPKVALSEGISDNPVANVLSMSDGAVPRSRPALNDKELGCLWEILCSEEFDLYNTRVLRISILLGGQRCKQLLRCRVADVDIGKRTLKLFDTKGRRKTPRPHSLPIVDAVFNDIIELYQNSIDLKNPYLFAGRKIAGKLTEGPISREMRSISKVLVSNGHIKEQFLYANIRSTIVTQMAALKIQPYVIDQIQSHGMGGVVEKHYDRWSYLPEKSEALEIWAKHLAECRKLATRR